MSHRESKKAASVSRGRDAIIVGAGHNGLVCAFYLARAGLDVLVVERSSQVGGACVTEELIPGARFSTCANILWQLQTKVEDDLELGRHGLQYDGIGHRTALFPDAEKLVLSLDAEATAAEVARLNPNDGRRLAEWNRFWAGGASLLHTFALREPPDPVQLRMQAVREGNEDILDVLLTKSVTDVCDSFFEDERVKATFVGGEDVGVRAPGGALIEAWWKTNRFTRPGQIGAGYPKGGMGSVTVAMRRAAEEAGAEVLVDVAVKRIIREGGEKAVVGVELEDGCSLHTPRAISNADPKFTFEHLLEEEEADGREEKWANRVGYQKFHALISDLPDLRPYFDGEQPEAVNRANTRICPSLDVLAEAHAAALAGELPEVPAIGGIFIPSVFDPGLAPDGQHTVSIWTLYGPSQLASGSWEAARREAGRRLIARVDEFIPNFAKSVIDWRMLLPVDVEAKHSMSNGNIRHLDVTPSQFLGNRPSPGWGHRSPIAGLYMCGAGTHPSGEVTGANGFNAARCVLEDIALDSNRAIPATASL